MDIQFPRIPYKTVYKDFHTNEVKTIRRVPPEKLHDILPTDKVELTTTLGADWKEGNIYTAKFIGPRSPNVIQIEDSKVGTTFVPYFELKLDSEVAERDGGKRIDKASSNKYLIWP